MSVLKISPDLSIETVNIMLFRLLAFTEDESKIRPQDFFAAIKNLAMNPVARPHVWTWVRVSWPRLVQRCVQNIILSFLLRTRSLSVKHVIA